MTIKELPRLILEIPRGTKKYKKIKALRTSSERTNGYGKEWTGMSNLRLRTLEAYAARVALCCIVIMLKKIMGLILQATIEHRNPSLAKSFITKKQPLNSKILLEIIYIERSEVKFLPKTDLQNLISTLAPYFRMKLPNCRGLVVVIWF